MFSQGKTEKSIRIRAICPQDGGVYSANFRLGRYVLRRNLPSGLAQWKEVDFWTAVRAAIQYKRWARGLAV